MTEVSWLAIACVAGVTLAIYAVHARRVRSGWYARFGPQQPVGLTGGEAVVAAWRGERYFGPLAPGSERTLGAWLGVVALNLVPGRHWLPTQPAIALRGAPLWLQLTDLDRLLVTIARGWAGSLRPRASWRRPDRAGYGLLLASGPERRARVRPAEEAFPGRPVGLLNRPDRQALARGEPSELIVIEGDGGEPLLAWCPPAALDALRGWSAGRAAPPPGR